MIVLSPLNLSVLRILDSISLRSEFVQFHPSLFKLLLRSFKLQLQRVVCTSLPCNLVMTSLNLLIGVKVALAEISISISQLAYLRVSQFLKHSGSLVPHDVLSAMVTGLCQQAFILIELRLLHITPTIATSSVIEVCNRVRLSGCESLTQCVSSEL